MARRRRNKKLIPSIAVVGDGKTEQHYFNGLKGEIKGFVSIKPDLPKHSDFEYVIDKAIELAKKPYDAVFCVIDMDKVFADNKFSEYTLSKKRLSKRKEIKSKIIFIENFPCFELWLILHFEYFSRHSTQCSAVENALKNYLPNYEKKDAFLKSVYRQVSDKGNFDRAIQNSGKLFQRKEESESSSAPYSEMHFLFRKIEKYLTP